MKVAVIGAAGHVGLPFAIVCSLSRAHQVIGYDINEPAINSIKEGKIPFIEENGEIYLKECFNLHTLQFTSNFEDVRAFSPNAIAIMIGTPVDEEGNPNLTGIIKVIDQLTSYLETHLGTLVLLRSTVSPGTTKLLKDRIEKATRLVEGKDYYLVFAPERVVQGRSINEAMEHPQLVGVFGDVSFDKAVEFFRGITSCIKLTPEEAEFGKLITNMYRYVTFALANEFYMIGQKKGIDVEKVIKASNNHYSRMALPLPGANVGGPCLYKDGKFLLDDVPYVDMIRASFEINEGMPDYIYNLIKTQDKSVNNILVLGAAFKANNDDTRNSLAFKFRKVCIKHGVNVQLYDPLVNHKYVHNVMPQGKFDAVV